MNRDDIIKQSLMLPHVSVEEELAGKIVLLRGRVKMSQDAEEDDDDEKERIHLVEFGGVTNQLWITNTAILGGAAPAAFIGQAGCDVSTRRRGVVVGAGFDLVVMRDETGEWSCHATKFLKD